MENLVFGILTVILCSIGYYLSWKFWRNDQYSLAIVLLLLCGLFLRIYVSADFYLHPWDERFHALVAKNLIKHPLKPTLYDNPVFPYDFKVWNGNYIWLHKQPLPLWTMSLSMWLFGINEISLRIPSIFLSTIGIWLTYSIGSYIFNRKVGYLAAFLYSINGLIIELTGGRVATDHIDIFFLFFIELAVFFSILFILKNKTFYNILAGISMGAAILSKWLPALIVLPIWLLLIVDSKKFKTTTILFQFTVMLFTSILIFLPWQIYIFNVFPAEARWEASFNFKHITEVLDEQTGPFYYYFNKIRINYGELIYLPLIWFLWKNFKNLKNKKELSIAAWFLIPFLFFSFVKTKMQAYILFTSPALIFMTADFFFWLSEYQKKYKLKLLTGLILLLLIALPLRYCIERIKPFKIIERNPQWVKDLKKIDNKEFRNGILFNYDKPVEAMFYTNLVTYSFIPDKETILNLIEKGYTVIINQNEEIPEDIKSLKGVIFENLEN